MQTRDGKVPGLCFWIEKASPRRRGDAEGTKNLPLIYANDTDRKRSEDLDIGKGKKTEATTHLPGSNLIWTTPGSRVT
jgi:hypothetical protein